MKSSSLPVSVLIFTLINIQKMYFLLICRRIPPTKVPWVKTYILTLTVLHWVHLIQVKAALQCACMNCVALPVKN